MKEKAFAQTAGVNKESDGFERLEEGSFDSRVAKKGG